MTVDTFYVNYRGKESGTKAYIIDSDSPIADLYSNSILLVIYTDKKIVTSMHFVTFGAVQNHIDEYKPKVRKYKFPITEETINDLFTKIIENRNVDFVIFLNIKCVLAWLKMLTLPISN